MNEHLRERFGRGNAFRREEARQSRSTKVTLFQANRSIRAYYQDAANSNGDGSTWFTQPEIPPVTEFWQPDADWVDEPIEMDENNVVGPYESREQYLETHYRLMREDCVAPLRDCIREIQESPEMMEKDSENSTCIYERVFISGLTFAPMGIAAKIRFSTKRIGKRINWEQSKRLQAGTLVALTYADDGFKTFCKIGIVAARPLSGVALNPPQIDIFFGEPQEIEIDPQQEWLMVESRNGYFEGYRHTLLALQHLRREKFPLEEYLVGMQRRIDAPRYLIDQPVRDVRQIYPEEGASELGTDILGDWPSQPCILDDSQLAALKRIMTKSLAIVQGPPGTGKTFVSVTALNLMLQNAGPADPPIIITSQTNHALDQILRLVSHFEPNFIRLGGRTKDKDIIKPRTLYEVRSNAKPAKIQGGLRAGAILKQDRFATTIIDMLALVSSNEDIHTALALKDHRVINETQYQSLLKGANEWITGQATATEPISVWLGDERIEPHLVEPEDYGYLEIEDEDLEIEQLDEAEAEQKKGDDDEIETLRGKFLSLHEPWTGRSSHSARRLPEEIEKEATRNDLWKVPREARGGVYRHFQHLLKDRLRRRVGALAKDYAAAAQEGKIGKFEIDHHYLQPAKIIGVTTTGLSKYRGLIQSLEPRVMMIEEAAQTLEGFAAVACMPSMQHLILVGDHAQLRGHSNDPCLSGFPFYLDVSLLERMARNHVEFTQLNVQRRMIPEIRRLVSPIYPELQDHRTTKTREPVPGMNGINSFFLAHEEPEVTDDMMSKMNPAEADMICHFFMYLVKNGIPPSKITVLTCYAGQRGLLRRKLRELPELRGLNTNVETVDSFQGEENAIVLLSLVRSNTRGQIGFLANENRACVALSRAQRGFYIFGDARALCRSSMLWWHVVQQMATDPRRVGFHLPMTCQNHKNVTYIRGVNEFEMMRDGGCLNRCKAKLKCGHVCPLYCHPMSHEKIPCAEDCDKLLECGHPCVKRCSAECQAACDCYKVFNPVVLKPAVTPKSTLPFREYAAGGYVESDRQLAIIAEQERAAYQAQVNQLLGPVDIKHLAAMQGISPEEPTLKDERPALDLPAQSAPKVRTSSIDEGTPKTNKLTLEDARWTSNSRPADIIKETTKANKSVFGDTSEPTMSAFRPSAPIFLPASSSVWGTQGKPDAASAVKTAKGHDKAAYNTSFPSLGKEKKPINVTLPKSDIASIRKTQSIGSMQNTIPVDDNQEPWTEILPNGKKSTPKPRLNNTQSVTPQKTASKATSSPAQSTHNADFDDSFPMLGNGKAPVAKQKFRDLWKEEKMKVNAWAPKNSTATPTGRERTPYEQSLAERDIPNTDPKQENVSPQKKQGSDGGSVHVMPSMSMAPLIPTRAATTSSANTKLQSNPSLPVPTKPAKAETSAESKAKPSAKVSEQHVQQTDVIGPNLLIPVTIGPTSVNGSHVHVSGSFTKSSRKANGLDHSGTNHERDVDGDADDEDEGDEAAENESPGGEAEKAEKEQSIGSSGANMPTLPPGMHLLDM